MCDDICLKFKNRRDSSRKITAEKEWPGRKPRAGGGQGWAAAWGKLLEAGNGVCLDLTEGDTGGNMCKHLPTCALNVCVW